MSDDTTKEMTPEDFIKYAHSQIAAAMKDDEKVSKQRMEALSKQLDAVMKQSFEGDSKPAIPVETFVESTTAKPASQESAIPAASSAATTFSSNVVKEDVEKLDELNAKFDEMKAALKKSDDGLSDPDAWPLDMNAEEFDENGVRKKKDPPAWGWDYAAT